MELREELIEFMKIIDKPVMDGITSIIDIYGNKYTIMGDITDMYDIPLLIINSEIEQFIFEKEKQYFHIFNPQEIIFLYKYFIKKEEIKNELNNYIFELLK